jgi:hypothetical protein
MERHATAAIFSVRRTRGGRRKNIGLGHKGKLRCRTFQPRCRSKNQSHQNTQRTFQLGTQRGQGPGRQDALYAQEKHEKRRGLKTEERLVSSRVRHQSEVNYQ